MKKLISFALVFAMLFSFAAPVYAAEDFAISMTADKRVCPLVTAARFGAAVDDADMTGQRRGIGLIDQPLYVSRQLSIINFPFMNGGNTGIITARIALLRPKHLQKDRRGLFFSVSHITRDVTHNRSPYTSIVNPS